MATKLSKPAQPAKQIYLRPTIKVPPPQVTINPGKGEEAMAAAMLKITELMQQIAEASLLVQNQQTEILNRLAQLKTPDVKVNVPRSKGRNYYVQLDKEDGETVGMRVMSDSPD